MTIRTLTAELLDAATPESRAVELCAGLFAALRELSPLTRAALESSVPSTPLDAGVALAPSLAASCLLDAERTRVFLRGVRETIELCATRGGCEVVYAGTGPFAPLVLLLAPWIPSSMRVTLLDIHESSTRSVSALCGLLDAAPVVRDVLTVDATKYRHGRPIDLLISETMQRSLAEEPFVEIVRNLRPQLARGAVMIPERVALSVLTVDARCEQERWNGATDTDDVRDRGRVFEVTAESDGPREPVAMTIEAAEQGERWLAIATDIVVRDRLVVPRYASGLTIPEILWEHAPLQGAGEFAFRYETGARPGLRIDCTSVAQS